MSPDLKEYIINYFKQNGEYRETMGSKHYYKVDPFSIRIGDITLTVDCYQCDIGNFNDYNLFMHGKEVMQVYLDDIDDDFKIYQFDKQMDTDNRYTEYTIEPYNKYIRPFLVSLMLKRQLEEDLKDKEIIIKKTKI